MYWHGLVRDLIASCSIETPSIHVREEFLMSMQAWLTPGERASNRFLSSPLLSLWPKTVVHPRFV